MDQPNHVGPTQRRRLFVGLFITATFGMMIVLSFPLARFIPTNPPGLGGILEFPSLIGPFGVLLPPVPPWSAPALAPKPLIAWTPVAAWSVPTKAADGETEEGPPTPRRSGRTARQVGTTARQVGTTVREPSPHQPTVGRDGAGLGARRTKGSAGQHELRVHEREGPAHPRRGGGSERDHEGRRPGTHRGPGGGKGSR